ncbi:hypothetical protein FALBO_2895 [Fusarium albosuccineum]|uniref:Uncharacterized protein n=2 Tax=Fusarium decemcellulare species complex TaxID=1329916 RepID=A0A8H4PGG4_9HYPO|nr:hypothetical protein FALBO_2895 [Fusarium albosuccineum]
MAKTPTGLNGSIWANGRPRPIAPLPSRRSSQSPSLSLPPPPPQAPKPANIPAYSAPTRLTPTQAFHRFEQACHRLRWKFLDLQSSYQRATHPEEFGFSKVDAERNFKVDFHEFYVWIEQAIVLLLLIFGVSISRGARPEDGGGGAGPMFSSRGVGRGGYVAAGHAYHHNVLKALEDEACPVYEAMGKGEVNQALWKAKELRNRWKDAGEGKETPPLKMYDLTWIVGQVLVGLEIGYGMAVRHVEQDMAQQQQQTGGDVLDETMGGGEDDEWEWMVEPMDWEAA